MNIKQWKEKYIPRGEAKKVLETAGVYHCVLTNWIKHGVSPNILGIIYISKAIHKLYGHEYRTVVTEGILAAGVKDE